MNGIDKIITSLNSSYKYYQIEDAMELPRGTMAYMKRKKSCSCACLSLFKLLAEKPEILEERILTPVYGPADKERR